MPSKYVLSIDLLAVQVVSWLVDSSAECDRIKALDSGADDCLSQSLSPKELSAYVRALLRRPNQIYNRKVQFHNYTFDLDCKCLTRDGVEIRLLPKECQLLEFFIRHPNYFFTADALLARLWQSGNQVSEGTVRTYIKTLRRKLQEPGGPSIIFTAPRQGYKIIVDSLAATSQINTGSVAKCEVLSA